MKRASAILLVTFLMVYGYAVASYPPSDTAEFRLCGRRLISLLTSVCNHRYARPKEDSGFYRRFKRSMGRGLAHDCCTNKCTVGHIKSTYCASSDEDE